MKKHIAIHTVPRGMSLTCDWCCHEVSQRQHFFTWPPHHHRQFCSFRCATDWLRSEARVRRQSNPWRAVRVHPSVVLLAHPVRLS